MQKETAVYAIKSNVPFHNKNFSLTFMH